MWSALATPQHGDFASNIAHAPGERQPAKTRARLPEALKSAVCPAHVALAKIEIAGALASSISSSSETSYHARDCPRARGECENYGKSQLGGGRRVLVEFVWRIPPARCTSVMGAMRPLERRHESARGRRLSSRARVRRERCRSADGDPRGEHLASIPRALQRDIRVSRERLPRRLPAAIAETCTRPKHRAVRSAADLQGSAADKPQGGDKDVYIDAVIARARNLLGASAFRRVLDSALSAILADIREDLQEFGVSFDSWFSERSLIDSGAIDRAVAALEAAGHAYLKDGALWFKSTDYGDEKDRVMVRENGIKTYFASDVAFVFNKRERG